MENLERHEENCEAGRGVSGTGRHQGHCGRKEITHHLKQPRERKGGPACLHRNGPSLTLHAADIDLLPSAGGAYSGIAVEYQQANSECDCMVTEWEEGRDRKVIARCCCVAARARANLHAVHWKAVAMVCEWQTAILVRKASFVRRRGRPAANAPPLSSPFQC
jgi:hypothetical protein